MILTMKEATVTPRTAHGAVQGRYVIRERQAGRELVIAPDTSWEAISQRAGGRELSTEEWDQFIRENGPDMLPADPEG